MNFIIFKLYTMTRVLMYNAWELFTLKIQMTSVARTLISFIFVEQILILFIYTFLSLFLRNFVCYKYTRKFTLIQMIFIFWNCKFYDCQFK